MSEYQKYYANRTLEGLTPQFTEFLCEYACDKAASLGLVTRTNDHTADYKLLKAASISLTPAPVPKAEFEKIYNLQTVFNKLLSNIVNRRPDWMIEILQEVNEPFLQKLLKLRKEVKANQFPQIGALQLMRNDYMCDPKLGMKNIEYNTIASSIGGIMTGVREVQSAVSKNIRNFKPQVHQASNLPTVPNNPLKCVDTIVKSHELYLRETGSKSAAILMVIEHGANWNMGDMRKMEFEINSRGIFTIRKSLTELSISHANSELILNDEGRLFLGELEISLVYYRAGYQPNQYSNDSEYEVRGLMERARAIKCPTIDYQLVGFKRIQIALSKAGVLERFFEEFGMDSAAIQTLRGSFARLWQASETDGFKNAIENPEQYVVKEQMEGGSQIIVGEEIPELLRAEQAKGSLNKWVIMDRIRPIEFDAVSCHYPKIFRAVSEIGIYTAMLDVLADEKQWESNTCGYLVRTKQSEATSGGFAIGVASADELYYIE